MAQVLLALPVVQQRRFIYDPQNPIYDPQTPLYDLQNLIYDPQNLIYDRRRRLPPVAQVLLALPVVQLRRLIYDSQTPIYDPQPQYKTSKTQYTTGAGGCRPWRKCSWRYRWSSRIASAL